MSPELIQAEGFDFWQETVCRILLEGDCVDAVPGSFHGQISTFRLPEVSFSRVASVGQRFHRGIRHVSHSRGDSIFLLLQLSGSGLVSQDGRDVLVAPGGFACADGARPMTLSFPGRFEQLAVRLPRELVVTALGPTERLTARRWPRDHHLVSLVSTFLRRLASTLDRVEPSTSERLSEVALSLILTTLGELSVPCVSDDPRWARNALRYRAEAFIDSHARDRLLKPETVAAALRISPRYLQDLFHDRQTTPSERIWRRRLEEGRRDLAHPALAAVTIGGIAQRCGFLDVAHFSRRFRAAYGVSPREFRAHHLGSRSFGPHSVIVST